MPDGLHLLRRPTCTSFLVADDAQKVFPVLTVDVGLIGKKVLVTTQNWFTGNDGLDYKAAYGELKAIHTSQETLGFTPSRQNTNWFIEIGSLVIAGCQVLYLQDCPEEPNFKKSAAWTVSNEQGFKEYDRPSIIYKA